MNNFLKGVMHLNWYFDMKTDTEIHFKLSAADKEKILSKMNDAGVTNLSAYMRKMAIDGYMIMLDLSDINEAVRLMKINSNNLNQYAKKANQTGGVFLEDINELKTQQQEIWNVLKEILIRLSNIY